MQTKKQVKIMKVEDTHYGKKITIPDYGCNSEFVYQVRNVRVLNKDFDRQFPMINSLANQESKIYKKLVLRLLEMERIFKKLPFDNEAIDKYEKEHNIDFNEYFHDTVDSYISQIDDISFRYAELASKYGYSYCV